MAGKAIARKSAELTSRVNVVESETSKQTVKGRYEGTGQDKKTLVKGESVLVPYSYFSIVEGKAQTIRQLQDAIADIHAPEHGNYPVARLLADINYGLEYCGRSAMRDGIDPSMTLKQRSVIETVTKLKNDGLGDYELWAGLLSQVGLNSEQITSALV